jgi:hypothetical protein
MGRLAQVERCLKDDLDRNKLLVQLRMIIGSVRICMATFGTTEDDFRRLVMD